MTSPDALPADYITPTEFCQRLRVSRRWFDRNNEAVPGVVRLSRKVVRIHLPTFTAQQCSPLKKGRRK
jgi:hypothetical protein